MQDKEFYPNGYGISIICNEFSYGGRDGLFEIAILKGDNEYYEVCYETHITSDVLGYLTENQVYDIIEMVKNLPISPEARGKRIETILDISC